ALDALIAANDDLYIFILAYSRSRPSVPWTKPATASAALRVSRLDADNELVRPKSSVSLLHAPADALDDPAAYSLAGYARLDDDDFAPIGPVAGPDDLQSIPVAWARTAHLQSLERLGAEAHNGPGTGAVPTPS